MAHGKTLELAEITLPEPIIVNQSAVQLTKDGKAINRRLRRAYGFRRGFEKPSSGKAVRKVDNMPAIRSSDPQERAEARRYQRKVLRDLEAGKLDELGEAA